MGEPKPVWSCLRAPKHQFSDGKMGPKCLNFNGKKCPLHFRIWWKNSWNVLQLKEWKNSEETGTFQVIMIVNISEYCEVLFPAWIVFKSPSFPGIWWNIFINKHSRTSGSSLPQLVRRGVWYGPCSLLGTDGPDPLPLITVSGMERVNRELCQTDVPRKFSEVLYHSYWLVWTLCLYRPAGPVKFVEKPEV